MSKLLDRFATLSRRARTFANGSSRPVHNNNRDWEDSYRQRWQFDKIDRSTHGELHRLLQLENLRQNGLVTGKPSRPIIRAPTAKSQHEPRGRPRGASYSGISTAPTA